MTAPLLADRWAEYRCHLCGNLSPAHHAHCQADPANSALPAWPEEEF